MKNNNDMQPTAPRQAAILPNALLAAVLFLLIIGGAYKFGKSLNKDIQYSKEIDSLQKEKLRLEIQLKKLELSKNSR